MVHSAFWWTGPPCVNVFHFTAFINSSYTSFIAVGVFPMQDGSLGLTSWRWCVCVSVGVGGWSLSSQFTLMIQFKLEATPKALPGPTTPGCTVQTRQKPWLALHLGDDKSPLSSEASHYSNQIGNHDMEWCINPRDCCWLRSRSLREHGD